MGKSKSFLKFSLCLNPYILVNEKKEQERKEERKKKEEGLLLKFGEDFYCRYEGEGRQREESRLSMAGRVNQTIRRERREERKRRATNQERQLGQRDQESGVAKMAVPFREEQLRAAQPLGWGVQGRELVISSKGP